MSYTTMNTDLSGTVLRLCKSTLMTFACRGPLYSQSILSVSRLDQALQTMSYTTMNTDLSGTVLRLCKSTLMTFACRGPLYSQSIQSVSRLDQALQTISAGCFLNKIYAGECQDSFL